MKKKKKERGRGPTGRWRRWTASRTHGGGRRQQTQDGRSRSRRRRRRRHASSRAGEGVVAGRRLAVVRTSHSRCLAGRVFNLGGRGRVIGFQIRAKVGEERGGVRDRVAETQTASQSG
ncbi:UNVERIFIED_CONTAM: hypothetical protein Sradi_2985300 [Sesamum radiatum]|uniref:Uncharacterized protein n=1 Tax=Sesamum radiatum TaxID=300843 RepID=A0AAW2RZW6_SESRA